MDKKTANKKAAKDARLAVIRVRGVTRINTKIKDTMDMINLYKSNFCCVLPNTEMYAGMLQKVKDYITWGEVNDETYNLLIEKRSEEFKGRETDSKKKIKYNDFFIFENKKIKKYFRLNAPRKGFGRKGIKCTYNEGGALGYRGSAINDLIKRMI